MSRNRLDRLARRVLIGTSAAVALVLILNTVTVLSLTQATDILAESNTMPMAVHRLAPPSVTPEADGRYVRRVHRLDGPYTSIQQALVACRPGDVIELAEDGPFDLLSRRVGNGRRAGLGPVPDGVTLRAAPGCRPALRLACTGAAEPGVGYTLVQGTGGALQVEGLHFVLEAHGDAATNPLSMIRLAGGKLIARQCTFTGRGPAADRVTAVALLDEGESGSSSSRVELDRCLFRNLGTIVQTPPGQARIDMTGCVAGTVRHLLAGSSKAPPAGTHASVVVRLYRNTLCVDGAMIWQTRADGVDVNAAENVIAGRGGLMCVGRDTQVAWMGVHNSYEPMRPGQRWLARMDPKTMALDWSIISVGQWSRRFDETAAGCVPLRFARSPGRLASPTDFALADGSPALRHGAQGGPVGAVISQLPLPPEVAAPTRLAQQPSDVIRR